jgi:hypothetical protein
MDPKMYCQLPRDLVHVMLIPLSLDQAVGTSIHSSEMESSSSVRPGNCGFKITDLLLDSCLYIANPMEKDVPLVAVCRFEIPAIAAIVDSG